uniref:Uncharacterized protein n=1 Tax=Tetradesmus obliquus TaxID=3088 RepID=A0A383VAE8_TETOB|eukprot:jgi/Sobl393_1/12443/SZX62557.1
MPQAAAVAAEAAAAAAEEPCPDAVPALSSFGSTHAAPALHDITFRPACAEDTAAAAAMFTAAFEEDPEIQFLHQGVQPHQYKPAIQALYSKSTRIFSCRKGCPSWRAVETATQELVAAASITPLKAYPSLLTYATHGLLLGRQWPTFGCLLRALQTSDSPAVATQHRQHPRHNR